MRKCWRCQREYDDLSHNTFCSCGATMDDINISINGSRDNFGIGSQFYDHKTKKYIDNFKSWERAGYSDPSESPRIKEPIRKLIKEKMKTAPKDNPKVLDYAMAM